MKNLYAQLLFVLIVLTSCSKVSQQKDPIPVHDTFTLQSKQVGEARVINVWMPENYSTLKMTLPVVYMADGGINEDFPHIANTLSKLIQEKKIRPVLLVGIENTQRRRDLTGYTDVATDKEIAPVVGGSEKFRAFIKEELFPEIEKRYRTTSERSIIGESLAGLFVMETFLVHPDLFTNYIAFDPSLWWNDHKLVKTAQEHLAQFPKTPKRLWFAGSDAEDIAQYTKALAAVLKTENTPNLQWKYSDEPKEKHHTIFRATKEKALIYALNDAAE